MHKSFLYVCALNSESISQKMLGSFCFYKILALQREISLMEALHQALSKCKIARSKVMEDP